MYQRVNIWLAIIVALGTVPSYILSIIVLTNGGLKWFNLLFGNYNALQNYGNGTGNIYSSVYSFFSYYSIIAGVLYIILLIISIILYRQWMEVLNGNILDTQRSFEKIAVDDVNVQSEIKASSSELENEVIPGWAFTVFLVSLILSIVVPGICYLIFYFEISQRSLYSFAFIPIAYISMAILGVISLIFFLIYLNQVISSSNDIYKAKIHIYSYLKSLRVFQSSLSPAPISQRNIFLVILLTIITGGIYWLYFIIKLSLEINNHINSDREILASVNPEGDYKKSFEQNAIKVEGVQQKQTEDIQKENFVSDIPQESVSPIQQQTGGNIPQEGIKKEATNNVKQVKEGEPFAFFDGFISVLDVIKAKPLIFIPVGVVLGISFILKFIVIKNFQFLGNIYIFSVTSFIFDVIEWALALLATLITILMMMGSELKSGYKQIFNFFVFATFMAFFITIGFWINMILGIIVLFFILYMPGWFSSLKESNFYDGFRWNVLFTFDGMTAGYALIISIGSSLLTLVPYAGIYLAFFVYILWTSNTYVYVIKSRKNSENSNI